MIDRLLADADLNVAIVTGLKVKVDFKRAHDVPLTGLEDSEVLAIAARERRVLVTHDEQTMPSHLRDFVQDSHSPGIILVPQSMSIGAAIAALKIICETCNPRDLENGVCRADTLYIYRF